MLQLDRLITRTHEEEKLKGTRYIYKEITSTVKTSQLGLIVKKGENGRMEEWKNGRMEVDIYILGHVRCGKRRFSAEHLS
jgi:hypothetical protein